MLPVQTQPALMVPGNQPAPVYVNGSGQAYPQAGAPVVISQPTKTIPPEAHCCCCIQIESANTCLLIFGVLSLINLIG